MNFWSVFVTGLLAGGASCAVVQGGLLAGAVARGHGSEREPSRHRFDDAVPVGGFLVGKLASHTLAGGLLGLLGNAAELGFRTRALMQIGAGVVMILMAANLLGARALRRLVPTPPPGVARLVRHSARSGFPAAPAVLGFLTILIPCGVTLSVMVLAVASGSPLTGAAGMAIFVLGTSPLFAVATPCAGRDGSCAATWARRPPWPSWWPDSSRSTPGSSWAALRSRCRVPGRSSPAAILAPKRRVPAA